MPSVPSSQDGTLGTVGDEMLGIPVHAIPPPVVHQGPIRLLDRKVSSATTCSLSCDDVPLALRLEACHAQGNQGLS